MQCQFRNKFHTLQCKNNKLLLSNHHLLWCNIYTLWGSSSSVCDGYEYFSTGWLQEGYFLKAKSNNNNMCILRTKCSPSQTLDDDPHNGLTRTAHMHALCLSKHLVAKLHTMIMFIKPTRINLKGVCNSTHCHSVLVSPWWCSIDKWHAERL
jgi:hypothetical protein